MGDAPLTFERDGLEISTDVRRVDLDAALALLRRTHWGRSLDRETLARGVANSLCFGLYDGLVLIGFARVITDYATYGYLTDVVVAEDRRGQGLGEWLVSCILAHPALQHLRRLALLTRDSADLYARFGFVSGTGGLGYMELVGGASAATRPSLGGTRSGFSAGPHSSARAGSPRCHAARPSRDHDPAAARSRAAD